MGALASINLAPLMERTQGSVKIRVALIDGPIAITHPDLNCVNIHELPSVRRGTCTRTESSACMHGTLVAGILCARRGSAAPAICPGCTLLIRPIFSETGMDYESMPSATSQELADALVDTVNAGAHVLNISAALIQPSTHGEYYLEEALNYAARRGVIVVAAAGNQGTVGSSVITRHSWVIPVAACDSQSRLLLQSNVGRSIGTRGLLAPGSNVSSLGANGSLAYFSGTSAAAPFVTGTIALLWSEFPALSSGQMKSAVINERARRRSTVVPPLLDARKAYEAIIRNQNGYLYRDHSGRRTS